MIFEQDSHSFFNSYQEEEPPSKEELQWHLSKLALEGAETCHCQEEGATKGKADL